MVESPHSPLERAKRPLQSTSGGQWMERYLSPHTHPGGSIWRTTLQKVRVLANLALRRALLGSGRRDALELLKGLSGSETGHDVLVVGSGPSANTLNLREVKKRQQAGRLRVVATNYFLQSPHAKTISPDYLVWADDVFHPHTDHSGPDPWEALASHQNTRLLVPWTWKKAITEQGLTSRTLYFDNDSAEGWSKNISPLRPRGYQGSTGVKALALALHLRPDTVFVIGIDLSNFKNFEVDGSNRVLRHPTHLKGTDSGIQEMGQYTVNGIADALYSTANQFLALRTHFSGRQVINLDASSLVDAFPKVAKHPLLKKQQAQLD